MIEINMNLVYTIINVIILYLLLRHFLIKPVTDIMEKRKQLIADGLQSAQDAQDGALKMKQESQRQSMTVFWKKRGTKRTA